MGFRGLSRPCEASTKSQNPFSLQDYDASGTRACIMLLKGSPQGPDEPWLPLFFRLCRKKKERALKRLKMILQTTVILADASFYFQTSPWAQDGPPLEGGGGGGSRKVVWTIFLKSDPLGGVVPRCPDEGAQSRNASAICFPAIAPSQLRSMCGTLHNKHQQTNVT